MTTEYAEKNLYPHVKQLRSAQRKRILVTGGAGFLGSHMVDRLMLMGHEVIVMDNFHTGAKDKVQHWIGHPNFSLMEHDIIEPVKVQVDEIYHLACPASPPTYQEDAVYTLYTAFTGTNNMLKLAEDQKARILIASTSEVYGDPLEHPQKETYWGNVNPIGPRACYDEGKRAAEALAYAFHNQHGVDLRVVRIFNTFGPRMAEDDGRVVSNFVKQSILGEDITIYGSGVQTRSFQYVHDLIDGMIRLMASNYTQPVNMGNPEEYTVNDFAQVIKKLVNTDSRIVHLPPAKDDPNQRRPDTTVAKENVGWQPRFSMMQGLEETVEYFRQVLKPEENGKQREQEANQQDL